MTQEELNGLRFYHEDNRKDEYLITMEGSTPVITWTFGASRDKRSTSYSILSILGNFNSGVWRPLNHEVNQYQIY